MVPLQPTTRHSHWQLAKDVKGGQYFKQTGRWYLAIEDARVPTGAMAELYRWAIHGLDVDGFDHWIGVWASYDDEPERVEVNDEGKRPGPFTPATLRRKAKALREEMERLQCQAYRKETLARRLEEGSIAG